MARLKTAIFNDSATKNVFSRFKRKVNEMCRKRFCVQSIGGPRAAEGVSGSYLAELLDHLLNADLSVLRDLALHVGEPLAELLVLLAEHRPLVELLAHLLPPQSQLRDTGVR